MGINCDLHMNPRGGAFDLSLHNLCHEVRMAAKKVPEGGRVFIGGRKELLSFRGEEVASSLFL